MKIIFTVISGSNATAETAFTRLASITPTCPTVCSGYSEEDPVDINVTPVELNGNILIPGQFSCSGGSSTDNGLPDREVSVSMAYDPYYTLCDAINTDAYGYYECSELRDDCDYEICILGPEDDYCGIDEFDIDIIRDFILGNICPFYYEWQQFAADADNNGSVTTGDIVHLENYLISGSYNIPLKWKYVSNTQFDQFSVDCNSQNRHLVPVVTNCSEINMDTDPVVEDWYGFPTGDLNSTCTTCGFRADPPILTRDFNDQIQLSLLPLTNNRVWLQISHYKSVDVFSVALKIGFDVEHITGIRLINQNVCSVQWKVDNDNGILKLVFVHLDAEILNNLALEISFRKPFFTPIHAWQIDRSDSKISNILIDESNSGYSLDLQYESDNQWQDIFPNPASDLLFFNAVDLNTFVVVKDLNGSIVKKELVTQNKIEVSNLPPACYLIEFSSQSIPILRRFIKI